MKSNQTDNNNAEPSQGTKISDSLVIGMGVFATVLGVGIIVATIISEMKQHNKPVYDIDDDDPY